jgi:hypothetical protein
MSSDKYADRLLEIHERSFTRQLNEVILFNCAMSLHGQCRRVVVVCSKIQRRYL